MARKEGVLYALLGDEEQDAIVIKGERTGAGWPWSGLGTGYAQDQYPWGFGRTLAAVDLESGELKWSLRKNEPLDSRATVLRNGRLFYYSEQNMTRRTSSEVMPERLAISSVVGSRLISCKRPFCVFLNLAGTRRLNAAGFARLIARS